jgi:hypothetical protein
VNFDADEGIGGETGLGNFSPANVFIVAGESASDQLLPVAGLWAAGWVEKILFFWNFLQ